MICCEVPDKTLIPTIRTYDAADYPERMAGIMLENGLAPTAMVRLRDAAFCLANGLDPLSTQGSHSALILNPDYNAQADRYGTGVHVIRAGYAAFPTFKAVESAQGVLLFSRDDGLNAWLQYHANTFFDKDYATDKLRIWDVAPLDASLRQKADAWSLAGVPEAYTSSELRTPPAEALVSPDVLKYGICRAEYDMGPTLENFCAFYQTEAHAPLHLTSRNRRIIDLLQIVINGDLPHRYRPQDWIGTTLGRMAQPAQRTQYSPHQFSEVAQRILAEKYPGIRCPDLPGMVDAKPFIGEVKNGYTTGTSAGHANGLLSGAAEKNKSASSPCLRANSKGVENARRHFKTMNMEQDKKITGQRPGTISVYASYDRNLHSWRIATG